MKYIFQIGIIAMISFAAELLYYFLPLPIPASVYGLVILFVLLCTKIIKLEQIENVADFLLLVMPIFFIEPSVGLMTSVDAIKGQAVVLVLMCVLSTIVVTVVTGLVAQLMIRMKQYRNKQEKSLSERDESYE